MKVRSLLITGIFAVSLFVASAATLVAPGSVSANSGCDNVNIVHCGINGSSLSANINSFQKIVAANDDNGHSDLDTVYAWAGASRSDLKNMDTGNTRLGTLYRNGDVKVDGEVVATDAWVAARFTEGEGFHKISDGVWARKTTTSFEKPSEEALVHYNGNGEVDWVALINCGNAVKVTPVKKEKPVAVKKALKCDSLTASATDNEKRVYNFNAQASTENTEIVSFVYDFGDGTSQTVNTNNNTAAVSHTYGVAGKSFTIRVSVNGRDQQNITADACVVTITTAAAPAAPAALPNTGAAGLLGVFTGTSAIGAIGHRWYTRKRRA